MLKRILNVIQKDLGFKLLSLLLAVLIWYAVVNANDPVETATFTVRVAVENESYIANGKQIYHIEDAYKTVMVYVRANRNTLKRISADSISVVADLTQIVDLERDPVMVPLTASCAGVNVTNITLSRTTIPITIENIATKTFQVMVDTQDSSPGSEYEVGRLTPNPEQLVISGPESIISTIDSVVAEIDVTGMTADGTRASILRIIDKNASALSDETIEDDLTFEGNVDSVSVQVDLWRKVSDVELKVEYSGEPAYGYHVESVTSTPESITVAGSEEGLQELAARGNRITIPAEMISVDGVTEDVAATLSLSSILPDEIIPARTTADTLTVRITVLSDEVREVSVDVDDIVIRNLGENLSVSYDTANFTIRIQGPGSIIKEVKPEDIKMTLDMSDLGEGDHAVPLVVELPDNVDLNAEVTINVHVKALALSDTGEQNG